MRLRLDDDATLPRAPLRGICAGMDVLDVMPSCRQGGVEVAAMARVQATA